MDLDKNSHLIDLRTEIYSKGKSPKARLKALFSTLARWSGDVLKHKVMRDIALKMNVAEVEFLRELIQEQVEKIDRKNSNHSCSLNVFSYHSNVFFSPLGELLFFAWLV